MKFNNKDSGEIKSYCETFYKTAIEQGCQYGIYIEVYLTNNSNIDIFHQ